MLGQSDIVVHLDNIAPGVTPSLEDFAIVTNQFRLTTDDDVFQVAEGAPFFNIYSVAGNDSLTGSSSNDIFYGGSGDDTLEGLNGSDGLYGEGGHDSLLGGLGRANREMTVFWEVQV